MTPTGYHTDVVRHDGAIIIISGHIQTIHIQIIDGATSAVDRLTNYRVDVEVTPVMNIRRYPQVSCSLPCGRVM